MSDKKTTILSSLKMLKNNFSNLKLPQLGSAVKLSRHLKKISFTVCPTVARRLPTTLTLGPLPAALPSPVGHSSKRRRSASVVG